MPHSKRYNDSPLAGPSFAYPVTPHDTDELGQNGQLPRGIYVGTGGDLTVNYADSDTDVLLRNVADGSELAHQLRRIKATGTTATDIVALA